MLFPGLVIPGPGLPAPIAGPGQARASSGDCERAGHIHGPAARRRGTWLTGDLAAAGPSVPAARECTGRNESGWLSGQARDVHPMMQRPGVVSLADAVRPRTARWERR